MEGRHQGDVCVIAAQTTHQATHQTTHQVVPARSPSSSTLSYLRQTIIGSFFFQQREGEKKKKAEKKKEEPSPVPEPKQEERCRVRKPIPRTQPIDVPFPHHHHHQEETAAPIPDRPQHRAVPANKKRAALLGRRARSPPRATETLATTGKEQGKQEGSNTIPVTTTTSTTHALGHAAAEEEESGAPSIAIESGSFTPSLHQRKHKVNQHTNENNQINHNRYVVIDAHGRRVVLPPPGFGCAASNSRRAEPEPLTLCRREVKRTTTPATATCIISRSVAEERERKKDKTSGRVNRVNNNALASHPDPEMALFLRLLAVEEDLVYGWDFSVF
ncbi:hypothetical protein F5Y17DRAFT_476733 [Xylariaceae sp. FL0594]|nr:hypothetical protein F5Y17DRAFT_476733 [Xylariaceae sp. FL0594]